jgi:predicted secreted hydrolase
MSEVRSFVAGGHVYCHFDRADKDVSECFGCSRLRRVHERASPPFIVCELEEIPKDLANDPQFIEWWYQHHRRAR